MVCSGVVSHASSIRNLDIDTCTHTQAGVVVVVVEVDIVGTAMAGGRGVVGTARHGSIRVSSSVTGHSPPPYLPAHGMAMHGLPSRADVRCERADNRTHTAMHTARKTPAASDTAACVQTTSKLHVCCMTKPYREAACVVGDLTGDLERLRIATTCRRKLFYHCQHASAALLAC